MPGFMEKVINNVALALGPVGVNYMKLTIVHVANATT